MTEPVKNEDILKAVQDLGQRFDGLEGRFDGLEKSVEDLGESVRDLATHVDKRFTKVESSMVTKDYLDRKLADLEVDLGTMTKDVDKKDSALVRTLQDKTIIDQSKANEIIAMSPFPQI